MNKIQFLHPRYKHAPSLVSPAGVKGADLKEVSMKKNDNKKQKKLARVHGVTGPAH